MMINSHTQLSPQSLQLHNNAYFYSGNSAAIENSVSPDFVHFSVITVEAPNKDSYHIEETNKTFPKRALAVSLSVKYILYNKYDFLVDLDNPHKTPFKMLFTEECLINTHDKLEIQKSLEDRKWTHNESQLTSLVTHKIMTSTPYKVNSLPEVRGSWAESRVQSQFNISHATNDFIIAQQKMILCFAHVLGKNVQPVAELISPEIRCQLFECMRREGGKINKANIVGSDCFMERLTKISNSIKQVCEYSINFHYPPIIGKTLLYPPVGTSDETTFLSAKVSLKLLTEEGEHEFVVQSNSEHVWGYHKGGFTSIEVTEVEKSKKVVPASAGFCVVQ